MSFEFVIEDGVSIPKREIEFAPRGSQYPFEQMKPGQSFAVPVEGVEGATKADGTVLSLADDAKRKAAQKQSYFSALGKKLGLNVVTRYFPEGEVDRNTGEATGQPTLRVWHNGERTEEQKAEDAKRAAERASKGQSEPSTSDADHDEPVYEQEGDDQLDL